MTRVVEVPRIVELQPCRVEAVALPEPPPRQDREACERAYGERGVDAVCYDPGEAWALRALLAALGETWRQAEACAAQPPAPPAGGP